MIRSRLNHMTGHRPEGMSRPADTPNGPNCGLTAIATAGGRSFAAVAHTFRTLYTRRGGWKGGTRGHERRAVMDRMGIRYVEVPLSRSMTLATWAAVYSTPGERYIVTTTGHVQTVGDLHVTDQNNNAVRLSRYWGRRKRVREVLRIVSA